MMAWQLQVGTLLASAALMACGGDTVQTPGGEEGGGAAAGGSTGQGGSGGGSGGGGVTGCGTGMGPGDHSFTLMHDNLERSYNLHLPSGYDDATDVPLVLNFHGFTSNPEDQEAFSGMTAVADAEGFAVLYPAGIGNSWNGGPACCGQAVSDDVDDVGFARQLVADAASKACIDEKRVYSTGMSNGGFMSHRLACQASDLVAAVAPVDGLLGVSPSDCTPSRPVPMVHYYGTEDTLVDYDYAVLTNDFWIAQHNCVDTAPEVTYQQGAATCETWDECDGGTTVTMCSVEGMGHCWPGQSFCPPSLGAANTDISANEHMWEMFQQHALP